MNQFNPNIPFFIPLQRGQTRNWNYTVENFYAGGSVQIVPGCIAFMFTNVGDVAARVGGMLVYQGVPGTSLGDSRSLGAHLMDLFKGRLSVEFIPGAGTAPNIEIVQIFYLEDTQNK